MLLRRWERSRQAPKITKTPRSSTKRSSRALGILRGYLQPLLPEHPRQRQGLLRGDTRYVRQEALGVKISSTSIRGTSHLR